MAMIATRSNHRCCTGILLLLFLLLQVVLALALALLFRDRFT